MELVQTAHDPTQLNKVWGQLDAAERNMPEVAILAAERMLFLGGQVSVVQQWLLPVWEQMIQPGTALASEQRMRLVQVLERSFAQGEGTPDAAWLTRIEAAQMANPREALLQYLAGVVCMRLSLWGKAQLLLRQSLAQLRDPALRRNAWRALAQLAEQREDATAAAEAWRNAAKE
jgi:HemY protein